jgi:hypothetical protein
MHRRAALQSKLAQKSCSNRPRANGFSLQTENLRHISDFRDANLGRIRHPSWDDREMLWPQRFMCFKLAPKPICTAEILRYSDVGPVRARQQLCRNVRCQGFRQKAVEFGPRGSHRVADHFAAEPETADGREERASASCYNHSTVRLPRAAGRESFGGSNTSACNHKARMAAPPCRSVARTDSGRDLQRAYADFVQKYRSHLPRHEHGSVFAGQ